MNDAIRQFRPALNWMSAALISLFVLFFALLAEGHVKPGATSPEDNLVTEFYTGKRQDSSRSWIRYR